MSTEEHKLTYAVHIILCIATDMQQSSQQKMKFYVERALALLKTENKTLANHQSAVFHALMKTKSNLKK